MELIAGFFMFIVWLVITFIAITFLGLNEKPKPEHYWRNACIFFIIQLICFCTGIWLWLCYQDEVAYVALCILFIGAAMAGLLGYTGRKR